MLLIENMKFLSARQLDLIRTAMRLLIFSDSGGSCAPCRRRIGDFALREGTRIVLMVKSIGWCLTFFEYSIVNQVIHFALCSVDREI